VNRIIPFVRRFLVVPLALAIASYASIIAKELSADDYGVVVDPPTVPPASEIVPPIDQDLDSSAVEKLHREKIVSRTVNCLENCAPLGQWGVFLDLSREKQKIEADDNSEDASQRSKDKVITAGIDRRFGKHLLGFSFGASDGEGEVELDPGNITGFDSVLNIDRNKYSAGLYYGYNLPWFVNFSAQVMASNYDYSANWYDPNILMDDAADYDGDGYSGAAALSAIVPMISGKFRFLFQPSISYQYVKSDTDPYISEQSVSYSGRDQRSTDLQLAFKWRVPRVVGQTVLSPYGGFAWSHLDRRVRVKGLSGYDATVRRDHDLVEGMLGITLQHNDFNVTFSYKHTIGSDDLERERLQLILRSRF
jgi:outer membrane autotransporter protein